MKNIYRLPVLIVFFFIIVVILFSGLSALSFWGSYYCENSQNLTNLILTRIPGIALSVLPVSVLVSIVFLLFRILKKPGNRFLSFLIPLAAACALMIFGYYGLYFIQAEKGIPLEPGAYLSAGRFNDPDGKVFYFEEIEDRMLKNIIVVEPTHSERLFSYYPDGVIKTGDYGAKAYLSGDSVNITLRPKYESIFRQDEFISSFIEDIQILNMELETLFNEFRMGFYALCFSLVFSFSAAGTLLRISKWPFFNILLGFLILRGFFYLFRFIREEIAEEIAKLINNQNITALLPVFFLLFFGILLLIIDILFVPGRQREKTYG